MRHQKIQLSIVLLFAGIAAAAQNLNPVVEVTNIYEQAATGIEKPEQVIAVPDSLLRFNLDMDYQMRTTPYRGAYEFNPYLVELRPSARSWGEESFYLRLGAGYGFHPELDLVWSPVKRDNFRLNLYANHQGYFGHYRMITREDQAFKGSDELYGGADADSRAGLNTLYAWKTGLLTADLHYQNLYSQDQWQETGHHIARLQARVQSAPQTSFYYNLGVMGRYLVRDGYQEKYIQADGGIGANMRRSQFRVDFQAESTFAPDGTVGQAAFIPRFVFRLGDLYMNLGVKAAFIFRSDEYYYPGNGGYVFPDVYLDYRVIPESFILQASATGGNRIHTYGNLLQENHFLPAFITGSFGTEVEHVKVAAGVRGNLGARFHYDAKAGYAYRTNAHLWGYNYMMGPCYVEMNPHIGHADYSLFFASLEAGWKSESIDADVNLLYQRTNLKEYNLFAPPVFSAQAGFFYKWGGRIKAGVTLDAATDRHSYWEVEEGTVQVSDTLPGYADLGLAGEFAFTRRFGAWLKVANLLNQQVQRTPFHVERGIYFTVGIQMRF